LGKFSRKEIPLATKKKTNPRGKQRKQFAFGHPPKAGTTKNSVILYAKRPEIGDKAAGRYRANRAMGHVFKTEFILQYLSEPQLRRRIRRGLLKVDPLHALARDVYYGRRGRINARELHEQMNSCSCLTLILACIIYWQAREIDRA
jgi:TnpA family transposase